MTIGIMPDMTHVWWWKSRLPERKGQACRVLARGSMNTVLVEFEDGYRVTTSRFAVRLLRPKHPAVGTMGIVGRFLCWIGLHDLSKVLMIHATWRNTRDCKRCGREIDVAPPKEYRWL